MMTPPHAPASGGSRWLRLLAIILVTGAGLLAAGLTMTSLTWPLVQDPLVTHYVAIQVLKGAAPYRDFFETAFPGVYLIHMLGAALLGTTDAAFRAIDLLLLGGIVAGIAVVQRRFGGLAVACAIGLFWLFHVAGGAWRMAHRDVMLCLPLVWATAAVSRYLEGGGLVMLGAASLGLGAAVWIKPFPAFLVLALLGLAWSKERHRRTSAVLTIGVGTVIPAAAILTWLATIGAIPEFLDVATRYLPLYRSFASSLTIALQGGGATLLGFATLALAGLFALHRTAHLDRDVRVLAVGLAYGFFNFFIQGKGWQYHLYPFALFAILIGATGVARALETRRQVLATVMLATLLVVAAGIGAAGLRNRDPEWLKARIAHGHVLADSLAPLMGPSDTVQLLDSSFIGVHALRLLGSRQPTRFLYDFPLYHSLDNPYIRSLRAELMAGLRARPPGVVAFCKRGALGHYGRLDTFPELRDWLDSNYTVPIEVAGFRIYALRGRALVTPHRAPTEASKKWTPYASSFDCNIPIPTPSPWAARISSPQ